MEEYTNDKYIYFAINALDILRTNPRVTPAMRDFTYIIIEMIVTMKKWEDIRLDSDCCGVILLALEEWEKIGFHGSSAVLREHYQKMLMDLRRWCSDEHGIRYKDALYRLPTP